jgi:hypothetical protein
VCALLPHPGDRFSRGPRRKLSGTSLEGGGVRMPRRVQGKTLTAGSRQAEFALRRSDLLRNSNTTRCWFLFVNDGILTILDSQ